MSADLLALLGQLAEARAKATPGPWQQDDEYPEDIVAPRTAGLDVASCDEGEADAALIVAAVNALPQLTAALRTIHARVQELRGTDRTIESQLFGDDLYELLTAALTPEQVQP